MILNFENVIEKLFFLMGEGKKVGNRRGFDLQPLKTNLGGRAESKRDVLDRKHVGTVDRFIDCLINMHYEVVEG